jgi:hypothetical protein
VKKLDSGVAPPALRVNKLLFVLPAILKQIQIFFYQFAYFLLSIDQVQMLSSAQFVIIFFASMCFLKTRY